MKKHAILALFTLIFVLVVLGTASATDPTTERVSITDTQGNDGSYDSVITPDGRYIAFESAADNLVTGDTNSNSDIFVKDGWTGAITRVSTTSTGGQSNGDSYNPSITPNGRYVTFYSYASNLVSGDTNGYSDIFVKDGWTGSITRVSTTATGGQATGGGSYDPVITPDGRYIAFESYTTNLVSGDTNTVTDVFVKDGWTGAIARVSTTAGGAQATGGESYNPVITPDGRYIAFDSEATNLVSGDTNVNRDVFVKDSWTGSITRVSTTATGQQATGGESYNPSITPNGRYISFYSYATNLVNGDTNSVSDVFVKDGWTGAITRISTNAGGTQGNDASYDPSITPDGRYIAFYSDSTNLVASDTNTVTDVFVKDGWTGAIARVSTTAGGAQATGGESYCPSITPNGRYIAFYSDASNLVASDTNGKNDVFVKDGWTGAITMVNMAANGSQTSGPSNQASITPDGRYIVFTSSSNNLVDGDTNGVSDIFVHDNVTKRTIRASTTSTGIEANGSSQSPSITPDGRYIAFYSYATNLADGDTNSARDVFVKDMWTGLITRVSTTSTGGQVNGDSIYPVITPNGRYISFYSSASNLVSGDANGDWDVFVKDGWTGAITMVSKAADGTQGNGESSNPSITPDGRYITFQSLATNLVPGDINGFMDIFVKDGWTGAITMISTTAAGIQGNGASYNPSITSNGRYIVFESTATNLVSGDTNTRRDIFVKDGWTGAITRVNTAANGSQGTGGDSYGSDITPDGHYIVFSSVASNLVSGDTNSKQDIFVKDGWTGAITRVSISTGGVQGNDDSYEASITPDGRYIVFTSEATNLVSGDTNVSRDIFIYKAW